MEKKYEKIAVGFIVVFSWFLMMPGCVQFIEEDIGPDAGPLSAGELSLDGFPLSVSGIDAPEDGYCEQLKTCLCGDSWDYELCIQNILSMTESECRVAMNSPMLDCGDDSGNED